MILVAVHLWVPVAARAVLHRHADGRPVVARSYVVQPGDTLWRIATRVAPGADPRPVIDDLAQANGLQAGSLVPGQVIRLPTAA